MTIEKIKQIKGSTKYLDILKERQSKMKDKIDKYWLMKTPIREEEMPPPPYILTKSEFPFKE